MFRSGSALTIKARSGSRKTKDNVVAKTGIWSRLDLILVIMKTLYAVLDCDVLTKEIQMCECNSLPIWSIITGIALNVVIV